MIKAYLLVFFSLIFTIQLNAQVVKKSKDLSKIKVPQINFAVPDTTLLIEEESDIFINEGVQKRPNTDKNYKEPVLIPAKKLEIVSEDTTDYDEFDEDIIEVSEEILIDTFWVKIAEHFAIWDNKKVDPYGFDADEFKDTIIFTLYDTTALNWSMPITSTRITSIFGSRHYRWHYGIDIGLNIGDPVLATFDGVVRIAKVDPRGYGNYVLVRHFNGLETLYGHLKRIDVGVGDPVKAGQQVGLGGNTGRSTGPHLHFETRYYGNAFNPQYIFDFENNTIKSNSFILEPTHYKYAKEVRTSYYHKVKRGDTLYSIARKYRVSVDKICKLNRIKKSTPLAVGRRLRVR